MFPLRRFDHHPKRHWTTRQQTLSMECMMDSTDQSRVNIREDQNYLQNSCHHLWDDLCLVVVPSFKWMSIKSIMTPFWTLNSSDCRAAPSCGRSRDRASPSRGPCRWETWWTTSELPRAFGSRRRRVVEKKGRDGQTAMNRKEQLKVLDSMPL